MLIRIADDVYVDPEVVSHVLGGEKEDQVVIHLRNGSWVRLIEANIHEIADNINGALTSVPQVERRIKDADPTQG